MRNLPKSISYSASSSSFSIWLIFAWQVPSLPANFGVKKLLSGEPASPLVNDTMSMASGYSTVTGTVIGPSVIARLPILTPRIRDSSSYSSSVTEKPGLTHYPTANTLSNG